MNYKEKRPWGSFENLLDTICCKVKEIIIEPNEAPSYHKNREVSYGDIVEVPIGCKHRIRNISEVQLKFIEVQLGDYFGEDDIVRLKDDYDR